MTAHTSGPEYTSAGDALREIDQAHRERLAALDARDEAAARKDALAKRAFEALLKLAIHDAVCALCGSHCGSHFGHTGDCLIPALCPHDGGHYGVALIARRARLCNICHEEIPDDN